jgi:hypothetical protein
MQAAGCAYDFPSELDRRFFAAPDPCQGQGIYGDVRVVYIFSQEALLSEGVIILTPAL